MATPTVTRRHPATGALRVLRILGCCGSSAPACSPSWAGSIWTCGWPATAPSSVIGPAFLLNAIAGFGLAVLLVVTPRD